MRQTDSGFTEFHDVKVEHDEVLGAPNAFILAFIQSERGSLFAPIVQLIFANVYLGIAHGTRRSPEVHPYPGQALETGRGSTINRGSLRPPRLW
jgi:hypothetical protein